MEAALPGSVEWKCVTSEIEPENEFENGTQFQDEVQHDLPIFVFMPLNLSESCS